MNGFFQWDFTELEPLDDLHLPCGAIKKAQDLAAELFGAKETFFLVNGVTSALLALFLSLCREGDKVLLTRISHKAALHGVLLSGARPVFLPVEKDSATGLPLNLTAEVAEKALQEHPEAKLLLVTSPSYWGVAADLLAIKELTAKYGVILAVDEAHGGHFPFYGGVLSHSAQAGADIWVHSAHKSLGALTPGAFLHLGSKRLTPRIKFWLQVLQTSSPSYPIMISLDLIRRQMALKGRSIFRNCWGWARRFRHELEKEGFMLFPGERNKDIAFDLCRVTVFSPHGCGRLLAERLAQKYRLQVEMAEENYLLAIVGPAQLSFSASVLAKKFKRAKEMLPCTGSKKNVLSPPLSFPSSFFTDGVGYGGENGGEKEKKSFFSPLPMSPKEALSRPRISLPLEDGVGKICGEMVVLSPPGIPLLSPGEIITEETLDFLRQKRAENRLFQGAADPSLSRIKVVKDLIKYSVKRERI